MTTVPQPARQDSITLAIVNARVWTGVARRPWADAVAVRGEKIAAVGSSAEVKKMIGPETRVIDARGGMVAPGGVGEHVRLPEPGSTLARGVLADLVLFDQDLTRAAPETIRDARVLLAVVGGRVVYEVAGP